MRKAIFIAIILCNSVCAQETPRIDSLKSFIAMAPNDSNKVNAYYQLGRQYDLYHSKEHITNFISAVELAKQIGYKRDINKIYNSLTSYLFFKEMYGVCAQYSLEYLDLVVIQGNEEEKFKVYTMLGNLSLKQNKFNDAFKYYGLVKQHRLETNNLPAYANVLTNMLILHSECKNYDSAIAYGFRAVEVYKKTNMRSEMANVILGIAEGFMKKGNYESAIHKAWESYTIYKDIDLDHGMCNSLFVMAQINALQNNIDSAIVINKRCLKYATNLSLLSIERDCYKELSQLYDQKNDFKNAYLNHVLYKKYEDSLAIEQQQGKLLEVEVRYDISKKEKLLLEQKVEIDSKNKLRNYLLLGIGGFSILLLISYRAYKQKKSSSEIIAKQKELVEDKQKEILDSINYAKRIQSAILANEDKIREYLPQSFLLYKPKDIVAGDFYFFEVNNDHIFYAAADCTGHGVPGALMSVVCSNSLTRCVKEFGLMDPGKILDKARELVVETLLKSGNEVKDGMDISFCVIKKDDPTKIKWAGANNPLWYIKDGKFNELKANKQPIGLCDDPKPFTTHSLNLNKEDVIYLFTDGYADQFGGPKGKKFKYKQLEEILTVIYSKEITEQQRILEEKFLNWKAELDQVDDVCVIGIRPVV